MGYDITKMSKYIILGYPIIKPIDGILIHTINLKKIMLCIYIYMGLSENREPKQLLANHSWPLDMAILGYTAIFRHTTKAYKGYASIP